MIDDRYEGRTIAKPKRRGFLRVADVIRFGDWDGTGTYRVEAVTLDGWVLRAADRTEREVHWLPEDWRKATPAEVARYERETLTDVCRAGHR
jgi:hypothetical protein